MATLYSGVRGGRYGREKKVSTLFNEMIECFVKLAFLSPTCIDSSAGGGLFFVL